MGSGPYCARGLGLPLRLDQRRLAAPRLPHHLLGPHAVDGLAALEAAVVRAGLDAQRAGGLHVEAPRPLLLDERVAVGLDAVLDRERGDRVRAERYLVVAAQLAEL